MKRVLGKLQEHFQEQVRRGGGAWHHHAPTTKRKRRCRRWMPCSHELDSAEPTRSKQQ